MANDIVIKKCKIVTRAPPNELATLSVTIDLEEILHTRCSCNYTSVEGMKF